jgi:valyl-tRNA synthetase
MQAGHRLCVKLWNVARFSQPFLEGAERAGPPGSGPAAAAWLPADRWLLSRLQRVIAAATEAFEAYEYAGARAAVAEFFWRDLADNYVELAKKRLYARGEAGHGAACAALNRAVNSLVKMLAPFMPYVTEAVYQALFAAGEGCSSVHRAAWPEADGALIDDEAERLGLELVAIATAVRRYKTERELRLGAELPSLLLATGDGAARRALQESRLDLVSVTRAAAIGIVEALPPGCEVLAGAGAVAVGIGSGDDGPVSS